MIPSGGVSSHAGSLEDPIAIGVENFQQWRFSVACPRRDPAKHAVFDKKGKLQGSIIAPKTHGAPGGRRSCG